MVGGPRQNNTGHRRVYRTPDRPPIAPTCVPSRRRHKSSASYRTRCQAEHRRTHHMQCTKYAGVTDDRACVGEAGRAMAERTTQTRSEAAPLYLVAKKTWAIEYLARDVIPKW